MWFCKKYSVCDECRVHFEPYRDTQDYGYLCPKHRKPKLEEKRRKDFVVSWANGNWEKLEEQAIEEYNKACLEKQRAYQTNGIAQGSQQMQDYYRGVLGGLGGIGNMPKR